MQNLDKEMTTEDYNNIPVYYCPHCLSLRIKMLNDYIDYCDNCGSTEIQTAHIEEWREMYRKRFNKDFC